MGLGGGGWGRRGDVGVGVAGFVWGRLCWGGLVAGDAGGHALGASGAASGVVVRGWAERGVAERGWAALGGARQGLVWARQGQAGEGRAAHVG